MSSVAGFYFFPTKKFQFENGTVAAAAVWSDNT